MNFTAKTFSELSTRELYEILRARESVFLLEQKIICQDLDRVDYECLHCALWEGDELLAVLRAYATDSGVKLGRVLSLTHGLGHGARLMTEALPEIARHFGTKKLYIHSQTHAAGFYSLFGFIPASEEFDEEGVPHILMTYNEN